MWWQDFLWGSWNGATAWIVLLVHVFHPETRAYYDLEGLLQDFPSERIGSAEPEPSPDNDRAHSAA